MHHPLYLWSDDVIPAYTVSVYEGLCLFVRHIFISLFGDALYFLVGHIFFLTDYYDVIKGQQYHKLVSH